MVTPLLKTEGPSAYSHRRAVPGRDLLDNNTDWSSSVSFSISLTVNGVKRNVELDDPRVTLLDLLRERLDLPGTKKGCDRGQCGACTVLVDGRRINSCLALAVSHDGAAITTIEGVARGDELHPVQAAFIAHDGFQCGFCTPGQIMSAHRPDRGRPGGRRSRAHPRGDERQSLPMLRPMSASSKPCWTRRKAWPKPQRRDAA